jgi:hypothetical protein
MIPLAQRLVAIAFSVVLFAVTLQLIRKHKLREEYALLWLFASGVILVGSIFGRIFPTLARFFGVTYSPTLALVFGLLFALVVMLSQSVILSSQANQLRDLAQSHALLEFRLRQLESAAKPEPATTEEEAAIRPKTTHTIQP